MKKLFSIGICFLLLLALTVSVSAAGAASLSGASSVTAGNNVELTLSVSGCPDATSASVQVNLGSGLELVSGTWLKSGSLSTFDVGNKVGAVGGLSSPDINGSLFKLVVKATTPSASAKSVSVTVVARNGATDVINTTASANIKINCSSHSFGAWEKLDATNHKHTCSACGASENAAHAWNSGEVTKQADCNQAGNTKYTCTVCGEIKNETISKTNNHTWGAWTKTEAPKCTTVGKQSRECSTCHTVETGDIPATGHKLGAWSETTKPSCTANGEETRFCSECSYKETKSVPALGHAFSNPTVTKQPTCTEAGEKSGKCTRCNQTTTESIPATGHKMGSWTSVKEATCTEKGEEARTCSNAGCTHKETRATKALGHKFANATVTKQATCTEAGIESGKCTRCGNETTNEIAPLGHAFGEMTVVKEPTIATTGLKEGKCTRCSETQQEVIPCSFTDETTGTQMTTEEGVFQEGTEIKIEVIEKEHASFEAVTKALKKVASKFVAYDVTAVRENVTVQPNGSLTLSFKIPDGFGKSVAVFYISDEGVAEKLESTVSEDGNYVSTTLTHFSSYAVVELAEEKDESQGNKGDSNATIGTDTPAQEEGKNPTGIIIAVCLILLGIGGAAAYYFFIFKKK